MQRSEEPLYDATGNAVAYIAGSDGTIFSWQGHAQAYIVGDKVYGWNGHHLGWFVNGRIYDSSGSAVGFTRQTCPVVTSVLHVKQVKSVKPVKSVRSLARLRPMLSSGRSAFTLVEFLAAGR